MADHRVHLRMYRGFREVVDGFTKNMAWVFEGAMGVFLAVSTFFTYLAWTLPAIVLAAAALGARVPSRDLGLAAAAFGLTVARAAGHGRLPALSGLDGRDSADHGGGLDGHHRAFARAPLPAPRGPLAGPDVRRDAGAVLVSR